MSAFKTIRATSRTPLFIFGDHASNHIPPELNNLGLYGDDLTRHIAWDIGTERIVRGLCARFGCAGHLAGVSRLVIDVHRAPSSPALIPATSDGTDIAANQALMAAQREQRLKLHADYHAGLSSALDAVKALDPLVVSIHSFTPKPRTGAHAAHGRQTEIGLMHKGDLQTTLAARAQFMQMKRRFKVDLNKPYSAFDLNYTIDHHIIPRGLRHLMIEIRQDLVDNDARADDMVPILSQAFKPLL